MLDTVTLASHRPLHPAVADALRAWNLTASPGWKFWLTQKGAQFPGDSAGPKLTGHHEETGFFVHGTTDALRGWTASLPRVLHGCNGIQLKTDTEIKQAFDKAEAILSQISTPPPSALPSHFRRVDIAFNLAYPEPERLILTLRNARHPWIRRGTECYANGNIRFSGIKASFTAYWKRPPQRSGMKRKAWLTPKVLRIELQLKKGDKIAEFLGVDEQRVIQLPPMAELYRRFRAFMCNFPASQQIDTPCTMAALLALFECYNFKLPGGETVLDWHRRDVGESGHSKMRKKVASLTAQFLQIDWATLLPPNCIPATVDVHIDGTTTLVPALPIPPPPPLQ